MVNPFFTRSILSAAVLGLAALAGTPGKPAVADSRPGQVSGEVLVTYRAGATAADVARVERSLGASRLRTLTSGKLHRLRLGTGKSTDAAIRAAKADPAVVAAQPNFLYRALQTTGTSVPNDTYYARYLWGLNNTGQDSGKVDADIDAPEAWFLGRGASDVVVAVIDTGVQTEHPDLKGNIWTNPGEVAGNGVDDEGNGYVDDIHGWNAVAGSGNPVDENGHGTHVAGTIGATGNDALGVTGIAWEVSIVALKFLAADGGGTTADAIGCLDYVHQLKDDGVNVVATNNSWGGGSYDQALKDAIGRSEERGILFVAAAGNGDGYGRPINNDRSPEYPASYNNTNIISVTATDRFDAKASWSNYGETTVDLGAPGVEILSTYPGNQLAFLSGTSMATPQVTGAVAVLAAHDRELTPAGLKARILNTGDPLSALKGMTVTGRRLNLFNALTNTAPAVPVPALSATARTQDSRGVAKTAFRVGEWVYLRVDVRSGSAAVANASVRAEIRTAAGKSYVRTAATNSLGYVVFSFRPASSDGRGTCTAAATVSKTGYANGSVTTSFAVN